jgi:hypothetical protein
MLLCEMNKKFLIGVVKCHNNIRKKLNNEISCLPGRKEDMLNALKMFHFLKSHLLCRGEISDQLAFIPLSSSLLIFFLFVCKLMTACKERK